MSGAPKHKCLPDEAVKDISDDKVRLENDQEKGHVCKAKLPKLKLVVALLEIQHEKHHAKGVEEERDKVMVAGHPKQKCIGKDVSFKVVHQALPVEKVVCAAEKVPTRLSSAKILLYQVIVRNHGRFFSCDFLCAMEITSLKTNVWIDAIKAMMPRGPDFRIR